MDLTLLRVERVRKGYTQEQLANILGFKNKSSYCLIENGKATVSIELANRIAIAFCRQSSRFFNKPDGQAITNKSE